MSLWDKVRGLWAGASGVMSAAPNPVSAVASAVGGVGQAVAAAETKADHGQLLQAGAAEGKLADVAQSQKNVAAGADARVDQRLRADVDKTRYLD